MTRSHVYRAPRPRRSDLDQFNFTPHSQPLFGDDDLTLSVASRPSSLREEAGALLGDGHHGSIAAFLRSLTPGIGVVVQYDDQPPSFGIFQDLRDGNLLLTNYNGYPGLVRLAVERVNAVSVF